MTEVYTVRHVHGRAMYTPYILPGRHIGGIPTREAYREVYPPREAKRGGFHLFYTPQRKAKREVFTVLHPSGRL